MDAGTTTAVVHDRRSAAESGGESTGHARAGSATFGAIPRNLRLVPSGTAGTASTKGAGGTNAAGDATGIRGAAGDAAGTRGAGPDAGGPGRVDPLAGAVTDADTAALVSRMGRGLLVSDLWYTRVLEPKSLVVTGLTRNGVWLVEDGRVTRAVRDLRFTQSYPRALGPGAVLEVGRRSVRLAGSLGRCLVGGAVAAAGLLEFHRRRVRLTAGRSFSYAHIMILTGGFPKGGTHGTLPCADGPPGSA